MDVEGDRALVSIVGGDLEHLVGDDGKVLDALQELTRLAVTRETGERSRLMLDVAGHRAARREALTALGTEAAERATSTGEPVRLEPMTPFERKVVHDAVAAAGLTSESEGVEPRRYVVVLPAADARRRMQPMTAPAGETPRARGGGPARRAGASCARYPDAADGLGAYADLLASDGVVRGLIGPREIGPAVEPAPGQLRRARGARAARAPAWPTSAPGPGCPACRSRWCVRTCAWCSSSRSLRRADVPQRGGRGARARRTGSRCCAAGPRTRAASRSTSSPPARWRRSTGWPAGRCRWCASGGVLLALKGDGGGRGGRRLPAGAGEGRRRPRRGAHLRRGRRRPAHDRGAGGPRDRRSPEGIPMSDGTSAPRDSGCAPTGLGWPVPHGAAPGWAGRPIRTTPTAIDPSSRGARVSADDTPLAGAAETAVAVKTRRFGDDLPAPRAHARHHRRQPEGRRRQDHLHGQPRRRARAAGPRRCSWSTSTRRATRPPRCRHRAPRRGARASTTCSSRAGRWPRSSSPVPDIDGLWCAPATLDLAGAEIELVVDGGPRAQAAQGGRRPTSPCTRRPTAGSTTCSSTARRAWACSPSTRSCAPTRCSSRSSASTTRSRASASSCAPSGLVTEELNPGLHVSTILLTMYDARTRLAAQVADEVRAHFGRARAAHGDPALGAGLRGAVVRPDGAHLRPGQHRGAVLPRGRARAGPPGARPDEVEVERPARTAASHEAFTEASPRR